MEPAYGALRKSIFPGVPPFINFVPIGGFTGEVISGPQYWDEESWDQDQLWRFTLAMERWINQCVESESKNSIANWQVSNSISSTLTRRNQRRSKTQSLLIRNPFEQRPDDAKKFSANHLGIKLVQFPKMRQISRKDYLGRYFYQMQQKFGIENFDFHPRTFVLPEDWEALKKSLVYSKKDLWIVKPPALSNGHKWRLRVLWRYFKEEIGLQEWDFQYIWDQIEDLVIKSILVALPDMRKEYQEMADVSTYNTYKLLGYDMMIDNDLKVHVLEVNGRPQLQSAVIDKAVNRPMLREMVKIIGYHIPESASAHRQFISEKFALGSEYGTHGNAMKYPVTFEYRIHTKVKWDDDVNKQKAFQNLQQREEYLDTILKEISPMDLRMLIKAEEELSQTNGFSRLFPSAKSHQYFKYFYRDGIPYYDRLLDAWEHKYANNRAKGIRTLRKYCNKAIHL